MRCRERKRVGEETVSIRYIIFVYYWIKERVGEIYFKRKYKRDAIVNIVIEQIRRDIGGKGEILQVDELFEERRRTDGKRSRSTEE